MPLLETSISSGALTAEWKRQLGVIPTPKFNEGTEFRLWRCPASQLRFFTPAAPGDGQFYAAMRETRSYYQIDKWEHEQALEMVRPGDRVLDVGCGDGAFLGNCVASGASAVGLELNPAAVVQARSAGLEVLDCQVESHLEANRGTYDLVCAFQVLEHVEAPLDFLNALAALVKPGGRLIVGVPNGDGWIADGGSIYQWPPHHLTWWGRASLAYLQCCLPVVLERIAQEPLRSTQRRARALALLEPSLVPGPRSGGLIGKIRRRLMGMSVLALSPRSHHDGETLLAVYQRNS